MSTAMEEPWSPEPELREPPPRRIQPSEFPDLNAPNVSMYRALGGALIAVGVILLVLGMSGRGAGMIVAAVVAVAGGALALTLPGRKAAQARERAERLVKTGRPIMARILSSANMTGSSQYGRTVTYMISLPGKEDPIRRDVNADERALPKRIPANVTALIDPANTNDAELYCALPFRAVAPAGAPAPDPLADLPTTVPAESQMGTVPADAAPSAQTQGQTQGQQQTPSSGYQGLPWE